METSLVSVIGILRDRSSEEVNQTIAALHRPSSAPALYIHIIAIYYAHDTTFIDYGNAVCKV